MDCILPCVLFFTAKDILIVADKDSHIQTLHVDLREEFLRKGLSLQLFISLSPGIESTERNSKEKKELCFTCVFIEKFLKNPRNIVHF